MTGESVGSNPTAASALPHEVQVDKCDEDKDKVHEVNSEMKVSEEGIGKIFNACTTVFILFIMLKSCAYYLYDLVIDITATELHNESEEGAKEDKKVDMGTCEVSESENNALGKTGCVVCNRICDSYPSHGIVNSYAIVLGNHMGGGNLGFPPLKFWYVVII